jgi:hypothetical protein
MSTVDRQGGEDLAGAWDLDPASLIETPTLRFPPGPAVVRPPLKGRTHDCKRLRAHPLQFPVTVPCCGRPAAPSPLSSASTPMAVIRGRKWPRLSLRAACGGWRSSGAPISTALLSCPNAGSSNGPPPVFGDLPGDRGSARIRGTARCRCRQLPLMGFADDGLSVPPAGAGSPRK